ncbi:MAG: hypothetical protein AAGE84_27035 [Cyanobacteria bacterium P01_G01_bin.39]
MKQLSATKIKWQEYLEYFSLKLAILLLIIDSLFILSHGIYWLTETNLINFPLSKVFMHKDLLPITEDQGYPEFFQYIKELWIALLLGFGYWQRKNLLFLAWSLLFSYLLLDDALIIHEKIGARFSHLFTDSFGLRSIDYGEVLISAIVGMFFLILIKWGYSQSSSVERKYCKFLILFLLALALVGIVFDLMHVIFMDNYYLNVIFALLEDGGEHIVMSFTLAFVYKINWQY